MPRDDKTIRIQSRSTKIQIRILKNADPDP